MVPSHLTQLKRLALVIPTVVPVMLASFAFGAPAMGWAVDDAARASAVCLLFVLAAVIFAPLLLPHPREARRRGFVVFWFCVSAFFNATWQVPLILFRSVITNAERSYENLPAFIAWWGYGAADSHYGRVTTWMMSEELWWLLAIVLSLVGLAYLKRGREPLAFVLLGVAGALESYNASLYIVENWLVDGFRNIPEGSVASLVLYWGFNPLWAFASGLASVYSFGFVLRFAEGASGERRGGEGARDASE